ncbi:hypothetical protein OF83DRAFT_1280048, partial [Amylostereum chailletii]
MMDQDEDACAFPNTKNSIHSDEPTDNANSDDETQKLKPWQRQSMDEVPLDNVLKHFLSLCVPDVTTLDKDALLRDCLEDVDLLCTDDDLVAGLNASLVDGKEDQHATFIAFVNLAFDKLDSAAGRGVSTLRSSPVWKSG